MSRAPESHVGSRSSASLHNPAWRALTLIPDAPPAELEVQPHGILLVVDPTSARIRQVSRNSGELLGKSPASLLGRRLEVVFAPEGCRALAMAMERHEQETVIVELEPLDRASAFEAVVRRIGEGWLLELEPKAGAYRLAPSDLGVRLRESLARIRSADSIAKLAQATAEEVRRLTRFDRVVTAEVVDGSWRTIAESRRDGVPSLLGLCFPGEEPPHCVAPHEPHGRVRAVVDTQVEPVLLEPPLDLGVEAIDLGHVSLGHRELLRALGIRASISVAIVANGAVWGFVIGHQLMEPRQLAYDLRSACELVGQMVGGQVEALERDIERRAQSRALHAIGKIVARSAGYRHDAMGLVAEQELVRELVGADGMAIVMEDGDVRACGQAPDAATSRAVAAILSDRLRDGGLIALSSLVDEPTIAAVDSSLCGILCLAVRAERPYALLWFRAEDVETLHWSHRPDDRTSGPFHETRRGQSRPWTRVERHAARELERRLVERGSRQLEEVASLNRELEAANAVRDEFLSALSHELRTPLNTIVGWAEMLSTGALAGPQVLRAAEVIQRNSDALRRQVDDLLDVSRLLRDKLRLETAPFDLGETLGAVVADLAEAARGRSVTIETEIAEDAHTLEGDRERIAQTIWNILDNAVKFTEDGTVRVRVSRHQADICIAVVDSGIGIDPELLPHVFDRFRQDRRGSRNARRGLGLGLALVRMLVELHGGRVEAESRGVGKGASFLVWLPAVSEKPVVPVDSHAGEHPPEAVTPDAIAAESSLAGVRLLVVEDDADSAELIASTLRMRGAEVVLAYDAEEAMDRLSPQPHVIVSDIDLPGMNGYEFIEAVRASEHACLPAVALSAFNSRRHRARALSAGFDAYFSKPADIDALARVIAAMARKPS